MEKLYKKIFGGVAAYRHIFRGDMVDDYRKGEPGPDYTEPFYVENITNANETLSIKKYRSSAPTITIEISSDRTNWSTLGTTDTTAITRTIIPGEKLYMRASTNSWATSSNNRNVIGGVSKVGGNSMSLLYGSGFTGNEVVFPSSNNYALGYMFYNAGNLQNASKLLLPATTLANYCYYGMFRGCTALTTAPATLPATTLTFSCYAQMFYNCTSLTIAPELPATTLADYCYQNMFRGCTSLTIAPELPATILISACYSSIFNGCTNLNYIKCLATNISASICTADWVKGVALTGTFVKNPSMTSWPTGASGIPDGWTVIDA